MASDLVISVAEKLIDTFGSAIIKEVCDMWGYQSQLEELTETVSTIRNVLLDAEAKQQLSHEEEDYIDKLKDVVYDADDLFDEFRTLAELKQLMKPLSKHDKFYEKVRQFFSSKNNQLGQAYRMSREVKKIKKRLDEIANCHNKFGLSVDNKPISMRPKETCSYIEAKDIIGRDKDKEAIINMLQKDNADEESGCVTIVGVGGLGKTALAQLVYNDEEVKKMFPDLRLWVCVSDQEGVQFDVKTILCKILEVVTSQNIDGNSTLELVNKQLQEKLREKKYLLVLDDVWNEGREKWVELKKNLMLGRGGSKIIVTTRSAITGRIISENMNNVYKLEGLSPENSWVLFEMSAFNKGHKDEYHDEFVAIGHDIVEACCNIPLAIKVVGSLLYGQGISKWQSIKESGLANIGKGGSKSDNDVMSILKLSYHNLAPSLKSCFSYCALFPKDYVLNKERLINLWIAQGYIMPGCQSIEDAAEEHFVILLRRCFFQDVVEDEYGHVWSVKIHDFMHDVAQEVAKKEIQIVTSNSEKLGCSIRHVGYADRDCVGTLFPNAKIRSILNLLGWSDNDKSVEVTEIYKLKFLRALELRRLGVVNLPDSIGGLIHLRYLDLSENNKLEVLPNAITRLHNLETLLLYECGKLRELPKDFFKLNKLRHLDVQDCTKLREFPKEFCRLDKLRHLDLINCTELSCMPSGMEKLTSLKVLTRFVVGKEASREAQRDDELKPLKALTGISGEIMIEIGEYYRKVEGMDDMGGGYLKGMKHLAKVVIEFDNHPECEGVLGTLEPPSNVKVLSIENYGGMMIPKWGRAVDDWAICLKQLTAIELSKCRNMQEMPVLSKLRFLKRLDLSELDNLEYMEIRIESQASDSEVEIFFPALKGIYMRKLKKLKGWWKGVDDDHRLNTTPFMRFPCLSSLDIMECPELTSFPSRPSLESLCFYRNNEALQIMVRAVGKECENVEINSQATSNLRTLDTDNLRHLRSLPIDCLMELSISERMGHEESVAEAFQRCASSLQDLSIRGIKNIRRLCGGSGLEHFTALNHLSLGVVTPRWSINDDKDDDDNILFWKSIPQNLRTLQFFLLEEETSLPTGMQCLTFLQSLDLFGCDKLEEIPDCIGGLSSLQSLSIRECPAIKSLPQSIQNLTSLQQLHIDGCPDLKERCKDPSGEDYPKIRHIPKRVAYPYAAGANALFPSPINVDVTVECLTVLATSNKLSLFVHQLF